MRRSLLAFSILLLASLACNGRQSIPPPPEKSVFDSGKTAYGFFPSPPEATLDSILQLYKEMSRHGDFVLVQQNTAWEDSVNGTDGESWRKARRVRATVSTSGLAFTLKGQRPFVGVTAECETREPLSRLTPIDGWGNTGVLTGGDVLLENPSGDVLARRSNARTYFPYGRRLFWWDRLDQTYFAGYALWNYLVFPALLLREDIRWQEAGPNRLLAGFPAHIPTHSRVQEFLFDPSSGLLRQHNYTAEVMGAWARAANVIIKHDARNGIPYPSHRLVTPRKKDGSPSGGPVVIDLIIHDWEVNPARLP